MSLFKSKDSIKKNSSIGQNGPTIFGNISKDPDYGKYNVESLIQNNELLTLFNLASHLLRHDLNIKLALWIYEYLNEKGYVDATFNLGMAYFVGYKVNINYQYALKLFLSISDKKEVTEYIASCYGNLGYIADQIMCLSNSGKSGNAASYLALGHVYDPHNKKNANIHFILAGQNGISDGYYYAAMNMFEMDQKEEALKYLRLAVDMGNLDAATSLGQKCQIMGLFDEAKKNLEIAASKGHPQAQGALGRMIMDGYGTNQEALYWLDACMKNGGTGSEGFDEHLRECLQWLRENS